MTSALYGCELLDSRPVHMTLKERRDGPHIWQDNNSQQKNIIVLWW